MIHTPPLPSPSDQVSVCCKRRKKAIFFLFNVQKITERQLVYFWMQLIYMVNGSRSTLGEQMFDFIM